MTTKEEKKVTKVWRRKQTEAESVLNLQGINSSC